ncbi:hypothetical protein [Burkholderia contaminans]|uniref:hypothetical protein n=1 Tax=Burkholderia contaminans TaxID=488447 RepID=UPI00139639BC|nr:hypothetical protein [Burkholderia contaminans]
MSAAAPEIIAAPALLRELRARGYDDHLKHLMGRFVPLLVALCRLGESQSGRSRILCQTFRPVSYQGS